MTATIGTASTSTATPEGLPRRRTLVVLAAAILVGTVALISTGADLAYDAESSRFAAAYDQSGTVVQVVGFAGMAVVALVLFFGAALRNVLRASTRTWLADVSLLGFAGLAATLASWSVTDLAMWKAVAFGDESAVRAVAIIADAGFLPLMAAMTAVYVGTGLAGLRTGTLPTWLAVASVVVGLLSILGKLAFVGTMLLPVWILATALTLRLEPAAQVHLPQADDEGGRA